MLLHTTKVKKNKQRGNPSLHSPSPGTSTNRILTMPFNDHLIISCLGNSLGSHTLPPPRSTFHLPISPSFGHRSLRASRTPRFPHDVHLPVYLVTTGEGYGRELDPIVAPLSALPSLSHRLPLASLAHVQCHRCTLVPYPYGFLPGPCNPCSCQKDPVHCRPAISSRTSA